VAALSLIRWGSETRRYCSVGRADTGEGTENSIKNYVPLTQVSLRTFVLRLLAGVYSGNKKWARS
jgi:hypothetical protein